MTASTDSADTEPTPEAVSSRNIWDLSEANWRALRDQPHTRGRFVTWLVLGVGGLISVCTLALGALTFISPLRRKDVRSERVDLGSTSAFTTGVYIKRRLSYTGFPGQQVAQRAAYIRRNAAGFVDPMTKKVDAFTVLWDRCAHLGCPVSFEGSEFVCPCHGGVYDSEGQRIAGPPLHSLDRFHYEVQSGRLVLFGAYSLYPTGRRDSDGHVIYKPGQLRTPGEATGGFEGAWYPLQNGEDT